MPTSRIQGPQHNSEISSETVSPQRNQRRSSEKPLTDVQKQRQEIQRRLTQRYDQYREMESRETSPDFDESEVDEVSDEVGAGERSESVDRADQGSQAHEMNAHILKKQVRELTILIQSSLMSNDDKEGFKEALSQIQEDHRSQNIPFEEALDALADLRGQVNQANQSMQKDISENLASQVSELKSDLAELKSSGHLTESQVSAFNNKATEILSKVKNGKMNALQAQSEMKGLKKSINDQLKSEFESNTQLREQNKDKIYQAMGLTMGLYRGTDEVTHPGSAWGFQKAQQIATLIQSAVRNGNWTAVKSALNVIPKNDANNVVQYLVGAIHLQFGKDENETMKALDLIPKDVREMMISKVTEESGELGSNENIQHTIEDERKWLTYWTPAGTSEILSRSIELSGKKKAEEGQAPQLGDSEEESVSDTEG